ncbi:hypothetical protein CR513_31105, partial [Mucuna pruriens]
MYGIIDFGPVSTIFPLEINEAYNYFGEKSPFVPEYTTIQQYETVDIKTPKQRLTGGKKFNNNLISKSKIDEWVKNNSKNNSKSTSQ